MKTIEKLQSRIDALDFYIVRYDGNYPSVNVKVHGRIKDIDEIADTMKVREPFKSQAVEIVKLRDREDYGNYFWNTCEREGGYAMDVIFEGVAHNRDEPEQKHIGILKQYKEKSGFFGRSGGHFCIGVTKDDLEQYLLDEEDTPREWLDKKMAEGFCTLCIRNLYPHKETEACKFINNNKEYAMQKPRM